MKLISMTAFVLEVFENSFGTEKYNIIEWQSKCEGFDKITKYAQFLKQPLNLGMFIPCVDGEIFNYSKHGNKKEFEDSAKKVIFSGFNVIQKSTYSIVQIKDKPIWITWNNKTIEEVLVPLGVDCAVYF